MGEIFNKAQYFCERLVLWSEKVKSRYLMRMQYRCDNMKT